MPAPQSRSGLNKGRRSAGKAVVDADGDPVMAETDEDGVFEFEGLVVGGYYFLMPQGTDLYTAVRNGGAGIKDDEPTDVVSEALTQAVVPNPKFKPAIPKWNYHTSTAAGVEANNFVLLYMNGEVEGEVSDPSVRSAHKYSTVELHRCLVSNQTEADDTAGSGGGLFSAATGCDRLLGRRCGSLCGRRRRMDCRRPHGRRLRGGCGPPGRVRACKRVRCGREGR